MISHLSEDACAFLELPGLDQKRRCVVGWEGMSEANQDIVCHLCPQCPPPPFAVQSILPGTDPKEEWKSGGGRNITLWNPIDDFPRLPEPAQYIVTMNVDSHSQNK